eukprot:TRINITY_DN11480_c0_g1_i1.p1 TRINITY_DN11480_c0_g1~~TRINITY_DN11480_c0_g1_i1.p1  ORF type:complete len:189 (-),score=28.82 TRINITY_DN11480_c0_g1_i1:144-710(-)
MNPQPRELYGGAIKCSVPARFLDICQVRHIPDHQEVFADPDTDQSVIFEILEYQSDVQNENSVIYHFNEIAQSNEAGQINIQRVGPISQEKMPFLSGNVQKWELYGTQSVSKYKESAQNMVNIYMCLIRLPQYHTDIVITLNDGVIVNPSSSSASHISRRPSSDETMTIWNHVIQSFNIVDYNLFQTG